MTACNYPILEQYLFVRVGEVEKSFRVNSRGKREFAAKVANIIETNVVMAR